MHVQQKQTTHKQTNKQEGKHVVLNSWTVSSRFLSGESYRAMSGEANKNYRSLVGPCVANQIAHLNDSRECFLFNDNM